MNMNRVNHDTHDNQLIILGIELIHKVFGLIDCNPELKNNPHAAKAYESAKQWNEKYFDIFHGLSAKEGA